ncbi:hypothetical protein E4U11_004100 [Claviceps purpurea]|nr:hypothetical protein E4U11_004100 [Claviceps purpurea]
MEGNGAANAARTGDEVVQFQPQDRDTRRRNPVTGERIGPRMHLLSAFRPHYRDGGRPPGATIAERIIQAPAIPRWPETSPGGTAVQYGNHLSKAGVNETKSAILGNTEVKIRKCICSGILRCEHLDPRLPESSIYTNLDAYCGELELHSVTMLEIEC